LTSAPDRGVPTEEAVVAQTIRRAAPTRPVGLQFVALAAVWGCSFLFIKIGLEGLSPGQVVLGRLASGAIALLAVSGVTRQRLPRDLSVWAHLAVVAVLLCVAPFLLFAWAEEHVTSAIASVLNATTPLMTMLVAIAALPEERPTRTRLAGLATGFAGVVLVLGPWAAAGRSAQAAGRGEDVLLGELACLLATLCYGLAFVYLRRFVAPRGLAAVAVATGQAGLGALIMVVLAPVVAVQPVHLTWRVVAAVLALGVLGTGVAYVWNTNVVNGWGATNASTVTYLTPVVGVVAGALVLGERITWNEPVGAAVVVLGVLVTQRRRLPALRRRPAPLASR
jgi:drug/metabolite transporter (DMT)-like permease